MQSFINRFFKILIFLLVPLGLFSACTSQEKSSQPIEFSFQEQRGVIDQLAQQKKQRLLKKINQYKVTKTAIRFHKNEKDAGGFFQIDYQFNRAREVGFYLIAERQNKTVFDVLSTYGKTPQDEIIVGRYLQPGAGTVRLYMVHPELEREKFLLHTFHFQTPRQKTEAEDVLKKWVNTTSSRYYSYALKSYQDGRRWRTHLKSDFHKFWIDQAPYRYQVEGEMGYDLDTGRERNTYSVYSILSGSAAIQESLQLQAMRNQQKQGRYSRDVELASIRSVQVKSHPFQKMMGEKKPAYFQIAGLVPFDNYYVHVSSFAKALELFELVNKKHSLLLGANDSTFIKNWQIKERTLKQLGLTVDSLRVKWFGDRLIDDLAITGEDPFLDNNTGISLVLKLKSGGDFQSEIDRIFQRIQKTEKAAEIVSSSYQTIKVQSLVTADGRISSHWALLGDYAVNANRLASLKRIIDVYRKKSPSMLENNDFHYMRTVFKGDRSDEDMFVYLSDAFIRKMISPKWVIGKLRRMTCANDLKNINNAILMRRKDNRLDIPTLQQLLDERYLQPKHLGCYAHDMSVSAKGVASSPTVGSLSNLIPINELKISSVSNWEAKIYRNFRNDYESFWNEFFDPIGIRVKLDDEIKVETVILPLIDNSIYRLVKEMVSTEPIQFEDSTSDQVIASLGLSLNKNRKIEKLLSELTEDFNSRLTMRGQPPLELFGKKLVINFHDHDLLFNIDHSFLMQRTGMFSRGDSFFFSLLFSAFNLPVSMTMDLKNPDAFYNMGGIEQLLWFLNGKSMFRNSTFNRVEPYQGQAIYQLTTKIWAVELKFYLAQVGEQLVVASKRYLLEEQLQKRLAMLSGKKSPTTHAVNAGLIIKPENFKRILPQMEEKFIARISENSQNNIRALEAFVTPQLPENFDLQAASYKYFGYTLDSLLGEKYTYDPTWGNVTTPNFKWIYSRNVPRQLSTKAKTAFEAEKLKKTKVLFKFTPEGIRTQVIIAR